MLDYCYIENIIKIMKLVVSFCLFLMTTCSAIENSTTKLEQQLNVQKREKEYLIEDDPNEGPEQKRDERQSVPVIDNRNLDPKGNSRIINIRMQPTPNILTAQKQSIKHGPQRIPTKIPVILKTAKVVPSPAQAVRLKILENKINETLCNANKQNNVCLNNAPPTMSKDSIPYYTIEDKTSRRSESLNNDDGNPDLGSNRNLSRDGKETSGNEGNNPLNNDSNYFQNKVKDDQVTYNSDKMATVHKPIHFFVDEPEPLPPSFRKQQQYENMSAQNKEVSPNKMKEMPIRKVGNKKPKKVETTKNEDDNDPDIVRISNGTHLITIKKIPDHEKYNIERLALRIGEEDAAPTEERIINHPPPEPKPQKPAYDEPEKHSFSITEKINMGKEPNLDLIGPPYRDNKNKEVKGQNNCITKTKHDNEEIEVKIPVSPLITLLPNPPMDHNDVIQESWNYLQNPYYNPYYQNIYDQYRRNYGLAQKIPNPCGPEVTSAQVNPCIYNQAPIEPYVTEMITPYYPNLSPPTDTDFTPYLYKPYVYETPSEIDDTAWPRHPEVYADNISDRIRKTWKDVEIKTRNPQINETEAPLDIDIRRDIDRNFDGAKVENSIGRVGSPYAASSQPISINGALVYPYVSSGYRYMR